MAPKKKNGTPHARRDAKQSSLPVHNGLKRNSPSPRASPKSTLNGVKKSSESSKTDSAPPHITDVSIPNTHPQNIKDKLNSSTFSSSLQPSALSERREELDYSEPKPSNIDSQSPDSAVSPPPQNGQLLFGSEKSSEKPEIAKASLHPSSSPQDPAPASTESKEEERAATPTKDSRSGSSSPLGKRKRADTSKAEATETAEEIDVHDQCTVSATADKLDGTIRPKRARKESVCTGYSAKSPDDFQPPYTAATTEEKRAWKGWVEIESNPSIFNVMLREFGIVGVKVQEIYSLDEDILATLPLPIYGIIFLFQYQATDEGTQDAPCPKNVWFANQLKGTNACGTIALLNIVNNVAEVDLGVELRHFKEETAMLTPQKRGERIDGYTHVKTIHNSFARKLDILQMDLGLYQDRIAAKKRAAKAAKAAASARNSAVKGKGKASTPKKATPAKKTVAYDKDSAFHYVAYMPIDSVIWKLDGLDKEPQNLGDCDHDTWLNTIAPLLQERMAEFSSSGVNFNMMALVKDPLVEQRRDLASNAKLIQAIEERLSSIKSDWRNFDDADMENAVLDVDLAYGLTSQILSSATLLPSAATRLAQDEDTTTLLEFRKRTLSQQTTLRAAICAEMESNVFDEKKAEGERKDYGPFVQAWLKELADCGELRDIADKVKAVADERKRARKRNGGR